MRVLTPFVATVLLIIAFLAAITVSATYDHGRPLYSWKKSTKSVAVSNSELMKEIRFYLPLENEHLLDEPHRNGRPHSDAELAALAAKFRPTTMDCLDEVHRVSDMAETDKNEANKAISRRLAQWRTIMAPSCKNVETASNSLKSAGIFDKCERKYDHYFCKELDVASVKKIFSLADNEVHRIEEPNHRVSRISATRDVNKNVPAGFTFVSNVHVSMNPEMHGRRHQRSSLETQSSYTVGDAPLNPTYYPTSGPASNAPDVVYYTSTTPTALNASIADSFKINTVYLSIKCEDKSVPAWNASSNSFACAASTKLPPTVTIEVIDANNYPASNSPFFYSFYDVKAANGGCAPSGLMLNPSSGMPFGDNSTIICPFNVNGASTVNYWRPIVIKATSYFGDNSTNPSAPAYNRAYWNSTFYGPSTLLPAEGQTTEFTTNRPQTAFFPDWNANDLLTPTTTGYAQVPNDFRNMYRVPSAEPVTVHADLAQGVLEFPGGGGAFGTGYNKTDIKVFVERTKNTRFNENLIDYVGLNCEEAAAGEAQLDAEVICGVAPAVPIAFWTFPTPGSANFGEVMNNWASQVIHPSTGPTFKVRPQTWSISYGSPEDSDRTSSYSQAMIRCNANLAMAASAGITVFVSSGDAGSSAVRGGFIFTPSFPANLPNGVVGVGATANRYLYNTSKIRREVSNAALGDLITSGGGVSTIFDVPSFQKSVFDSNIAPLIAGKGIQNGYVNPSVSMMGSYIMAVIEGVSQSVSGTSASSPLMMSIVTLVNNRLLQAGKTTLKNGNAFVYNNAHIFEDVGPGGDNAFGSGFGNNLRSQPLAWRTTTGYDVPTGFGEASNFTSLVDAVFAWQQANPAPAPFPTAIPTPSPNASNNTNPGSNESGKALGITFGVFGIIVLGFVIYVIIKKRKDANDDGTGYSNVDNSGSQTQGINSGEQQGNNYATV